MQPALQIAGLQQYWRRLEEMGYTEVGKILKLRRGKVRPLNRDLRVLPPLSRAHIYGLPPVCG